MMLLAFSACSGEIGVVPDASVPPVDGGPEVPLVERVPLRLTLETSIGSCVSFGADERLVAVSPEGDAWIRTSTGVRVVTSEGLESAVELPITTLQHAHALSASEAVFVGDDHLWRVSADGNEPIYLPRPMGTPRQVCGDPRGNGPFFLLTSVGLHQRRDDGYYRLTSTQLAADVHIDEIADVGGACSSQEPALWVRALQQAHRLTYGGDATSVRMEDLGNVQGLALSSSNEAALLSADRIYLGAGDFNRFEWTEVSFEAGDVTSYDFEAGVLWAVVDDHLYRRSPEGVWVELDVGEAEMLRVVAHAAGGAITVSNDEVCHRGLGDSLHVRGLRPFERRTSDRMELFVTSSTPGATLQVELDGEMVRELGAPEAGGWHLGALSMGSAGWHTLGLISSVRDQHVRREIRYAILPGLDVGWDEDIRPIFESRCKDCHGDDGEATDLTGYEEWRSRADRIRERVVGGQMPPTPEAPLSLEEAAVISAWVEGGTKP